nr:RNA-directed DNA polymerase, eukaryota [Tanacetum cinerariifolium]
MKISNSVFVTNFPEHFSSQDLWKVCNAYGKVIDVYIPHKNQKQERNLLSFVYSSGESGSPHCENKTDDPTFPSGFTPGDMADNPVGTKDDSIDKPMGDVQSNKEGRSSSKSGNNSILNIKPGGSILDVMENLVEIGQTMGYNIDECMKNIESIIGDQGEYREINRKHKVNFVTIQEIKIENIGLFMVKALWDSFVAIRGTWVPTSTKLLIVSIYAPQEVSERRILWDYIGHLIEQWDGECVILGDFNEVRMKLERFGTVFNALGANAFNQFIASASLVDLPLEGYSFTWAHKSASKMSKLDRFLVSEGLLSVFPSLSAICLDRHLFDHRPILMRELVVDYGPTPFWIFNSWFSKLGFDKIVEYTWNNSIIVENNSIVLLKRKLQNLKLIDQGNGTEDLVKERTGHLKHLQDINNQKAKIRWSIKGDENSKYFHVKNEFLNHFTNRFSKPVRPKILLDSQMLHTLALEQVDDLERNVTYGEIKRAVWDCGTNKSSGPDGFSFDFIHRYWKIIDKDVVKAVEEFFNSSYFPPGCNASFITLLPKMQDAKLVKDFCPITLIGCIYKIVAKILANRLSLVISELVSDVQSTFVSSRQILDGPFILNELIS